MTLEEVLIGGYLAFEGEVYIGSGRAFIVRKEGEIKKNQCQSLLS